MVLDVDPNKRRISLGLKQTMANPWEAFLDRIPIGTESKASQEHHRIRSVRRPAGEIDGMVHMSDLDWEKSGEEAIEAYTRATWSRSKVLDVDVDKERISLGVKQLTAIRSNRANVDVNRGAVCHRVRSRKIDDGGIEVTINDGSRLHPPLRPVARSCRAAPGPFAVGEKVDAKSRQIDKRPAASACRSKRAKSRKRRRRWHRLRFSPTRRIAWAISSVRPCGRSVLPRMTPTTLNPRTTKPPDVTGCGIRGEPVDIANVRPVFPCSVKKRQNH